MAKRKVVNVHEAKTHLSRLLERVTAGDEVVIAKAGKPVAVPGKRSIGIDAGRVFIAEDFDAPLPDDLLEGFER